MINKMVPMASPFLNYVRRIEAPWTFLTPRTAAALQLLRRHEASDLDVRCHPIVTGMMKGKQFY
jgi:hypothetical protein